MKKVTILAPHNTMATTIFGPMDILNQAGRLWNQVHGLPKAPFFDVSIASADGQPIRSVNNVFIQPHLGIEDVIQTDLIIISSATYIDQILEKTPKVTDWLRLHYNQGTHIASICTGVFLLAETGLLDGKTATLHWGFTDMFRRRYPKVRLEQERIFIDHGSLYCSAGVSAGLDLCLYLVEKYCGKRIAVESAKTMVLDMGRLSQNPYGSLTLRKDHGDALVGKIQDWIEANGSQDIDYDWLANEFGVSLRSMERRFRRSVGVTPLGYLHKVRVEKAKLLLEEGKLNFTEITFEVGYEDVPFFRKIFFRHTGLKPYEYRNKFSGYSVRGSQG